MSKLALKRLTASDLTFFVWQYRNRNAGNQKSINLNADVFVDDLYPGVPAIAQSMGNKIPVSLVLYGPEMKGPYTIARHITKGNTYKNWRLNGEFVPNPDDDNTRFDILSPGDFALFSFNGEHYPSAVHIAFVSANAANDSALHTQFLGIIPQESRHSMVELTQDALSEACDLTALPEEHPVRQFTLDKEFEEALQDATYGSSEPTRRARRRRGSRKISAAEMAIARSNAERVGRDGEELVNFYLQGKLASREIEDFTWISLSDAAAPFDFEITSLGGQRIKIDAKSTEGSFQRAVHLSAAETAEAAEAETPYSIYRVYEMDEEGGKLRVANDIRATARQLQEWTTVLPQGVVPDGFSISPDALEWEEEVAISRPDDADGEG